MEKDVAYIMRIKPQLFIFEKAKVHFTFYRLFCAFMRISFYIGYYRFLAGSEVENIAIDT